MTEDLRARVGGAAIGWLVANRGRLFEWPSSEPSPLPRLKRIGELAMVAGDVLRTRVRRPPIPGEDRIDGVLEECWEALRGGDDLRFAIGLQPALIPLATIYPPFFQAGLRNISLEQMIAKTSRNLRLELHTELMLAMAMRAIEIEPPTDPEALLAKSWIARQPPPWELANRNVAYAVTHTIFYLRDGAPKLLKRHTPFLDLWLPAWLRHFDGIGHWDLVAELVASTYSIGRSVPNSVWQHLAAVQTADGMIPFASTGFGGLAQEFAAAYHSTVATVVAAVHCIEKGRSPMVTT